MMALRDKTRFRSAGLALVFAAFTAGIPVAVCCEDSCCGEGSKSCGDAPAQCHADQRLLTRSQDHCDCETVVEHTEVEAIPEAYTILSVSKTLSSLPVVDRTTQASAVHKSCFSSAHLGSIPCQYNIPILNSSLLI
jgi:hypothetical protein